MRRVWIASGLVALAALSGCTPYQREWQPKPRLCQIWVIDHHRRDAVCVSREEFDRYWRPVLLPPSQ
jgi:hypothetical protein